MKKVYMIIVLAAVFALALVQDRQSAKSQSLHVQGIDSVVSAQLYPSHAGAGNTILALDITKEKDKELIAKVLNWLNASEYVGEAKDQFVSFGGSPTILSIKFQSGEVLNIKDAVGSISRKVDTGVEVRSQAIQEQVTVFVGNKPLRIVAHDLKAWIENGWQQEEPFTFTPEEAVALVLKEHSEFPATGDKQVNEDIGGIQGHKQPVTLSTKVEKRGLLDYIVTLTKDYNLRIGDKDAIQYWVFSVNPSNVTLIDQQGNVPVIK